MKECKRCHEVKSFSEYRSQKDTKDGLRSWCKGCYYTYCKEWKGKNKIMTSQVTLDGHKVCALCKEDKPFNAYAKNGATKGGFYSYCKDCKRNYSRIRHYKKKYGLMPEDIPATCEVCGFSPEGEWSRSNRICVDHDHITGENRGFLCNNCNLILGMIEDDPALLEKLALYLRERK